ncbi:hypothetical protein APY04_2261 [Hyphomicrobium sulfonivorans]|uniref:Uncharacterized protein n=1 Tax=Hyphomicrobium sulfonivorans TaxID=121290 RepID=A0A120CUW4_HYPSL|nr:hypothetical protein APY04_2261 [Hyphomicrobium sulfonivorans]
MGDAFQPGTPFQSNRQRAAMNLLMRVFVGVVAAWITPDATPQRSHHGPSECAYEDRCQDMRSRLRVVR